MHVSLYRPNRADKVFIKFVLLCILCKFRNHGLNADCETHGQIEPFGYAAKHFIAVQRFLNTRFLRKVCVVDQCIDFDSSRARDLLDHVKVGFEFGGEGTPCVHNIQNLNGTAVDFAEETVVLAECNCPGVVTSDIDEAVRGADYIFICVPGNRHEEYAKLLKGHTTADQIVITFNGCMASLIYKNVWGDDDTCPVFVESTIPPFSTRRVEPGKVRMFERHLAPIAFFPASAADKYYDRIIADIYEFPGKFEDVLECGLSLVNPTVHPGPCLVNLSNIEKPDFTFFLYEHGFQPSGLKIDVLLNKERLRIGEAFGYKIHALEDFAGVDTIDSWEPMYAMGHGCHALTSIAGPNDINYRYLTEDIPIALVCWASIADQLGIETPIMDAVITLIGVAHDTDWFVNGRTAEKLGLSGKTIEEISRYAKTGRF